MRIGIDLGGTKVEGVLLSSDGQVLGRAREDTPGTHDELLAALASMVQSLGSEAAGSASVGLCTPGMTDAAGVLCNAHNTPSNGEALQADLAERLGREIRVANDADCFALSEATDGAAAGASSVFGVILGTGCGGGIVNDGRLQEGANSIRGEWGHNPLPWMETDEFPGPPCYCGKFGCIERFISGPGLERDHETRSGQGLGAREIAKQAAGGNEDCIETLERHAHRVARALASIINVLDPDAIVFGGGISNLVGLYDRVPEIWNEFVFGGRVRTRLLQSKHGAASGVRGAAWLWPEPPA